MKTVSFGAALSEERDKVHSLTQHARERCTQRKIGEQEVLDALKNGKWSRGRPRPSGNPTSIYTHDRVVCIVDDISKEIVTTYTRPEAIEKMPVGSDRIRDHDAAKDKLGKNPRLWKSYTVVLVDTSGSMRRSDVSGSKTRLEAVWKALANDYVYQRIQGDGAGLEDGVAILSLGETCRVLLEGEPTSWVLYNKICGFLNKKDAKPRGHGYYIPSLKKAEQILHEHLLNPSCVVNLVLLSDGAPSDFQAMRTSRDLSQAAIKHNIVELARKFGSRLVFSAIGIGNPGGDFEMLSRMVDAAKEYGVKASFSLPSKTTAGIATSFSLSATALTTVQTEMIDSFMSSGEMQLYKHESRTEAAIIPKKINGNDYSKFPRHEVRLEIFREINCQKIENSSKKRWKGKFIEVPLKYPQTNTVVLKKAALGQGRERYAFQLYEVGKRNQVLGSPMVAKVGKQIGETGEPSAFIKRHARTQQFTRRIAKEFNAKLHGLKRIGKHTPRMQVLDCWIYHLGQRMCVLAEPRLDHLKWTKWNSNNGFVQETGPSQRSETTRIMLMRKLVQELGLASDTLDDVSRSQCKSHPAHMDMNYLEIIDESKEIVSENREPDSNDDDSESGNENEFEFTVDCDAGSTCPSNGATAKDFTAFEVAQAFSHFSFVASGEKRLICDLQGVNDKESNTLQISDPVVHYYNRRKEHRKSVHGRTDLGYSGIMMFFKNHECSELCKLVTGGFRTPIYRSTATGTKESDTPMLKKARMN